MFSQRMKKFPRGNKPEVLQHIFASVAQKLIMLSCFAYLNVVRPVCVRVFCLPTDTCGICSEVLTRHGNIQYIHILEDLDDRFFFRIVLSMLV